ncbi:MAG: ade [Bacteroidetes bacterium]|jgi:adenine deaminase|nr:ade [Bacteroidota bacterium]
MTFSFKTNLIDILDREIYAAQVTVEEGKIRSIERISETVQGFTLPGFIDAHVHIESSMLVPSEFARLATVHGTVATISDPHEIANVMGMEGVNYMIENGKKVPFHFFFGAPSCVPATKFETAGAEINAADIDALLSRPEIVYLAEMMNYPGVIYGDKEVHEKIKIAQKHNKPIDGHAPGLQGEQMRNYFYAGTEDRWPVISTDHECFTFDEADGKLDQGVNIMIREGSAAKNFNELIPLLNYYPSKIMFCCDDKHPDSLIHEHINGHVKRALKAGYDLFDVLQAASMNVINHYQLPVGVLQQGQSADFIQIDTLDDFNILKTYIKGILVAENGKPLIASIPAATINNFSCKKRSQADFALDINGNTIRVIEALNGQLITKELHENILPEGNNFQSDVEKDILKIVVVNRYNDAPVSVAYIKNFGLKKGAIASCVAHDCHNIVAVSTNDEDLCKAVNTIIENKGGLSLNSGSESMSIALPIAGIMTDKDGYTIAEEYTNIDKKAKELGSKLDAPFMTLSFMALLVIPQLKLSDKGLFNGSTFEFTSVAINNERAMSS